MKLMKILSLVAMFAFVTAFAACGKKDESKDKNKAKPAPADEKADEKPADTPDVKAPEAKTDEAAGGEASEMDWEKAIEFTEKMADLIEANKEDCKKMGEELAKFLDENKELIEKSKTMQSDPEKAKEFMEKYKDRMTAATTKMAAMGKCAADPAMAEAMKKMQQ